MTTVWVPYGSLKIPVEVRFIATRRLTVTVNPDMTVAATAPESASIEEVESRLERRAGWISRQRSYFEQFQPERPEPQYVSGASLWYLGRQYRLKVLDGRGPAKLVGRHLVVPGKTPAATRRKVEGWYLGRAQARFSDRLVRCHAAVKPLLPLPVPTLKVRRMVRRWGSCTADGTIVLNTDLVKAPLHCIDYVIVHELCHLKIHRHDAEFYRLLTSCMPDWQRRKDRLESFVL